MLLERCVYKFCIQITPYYNRKLHFLSYLTDCYFRTKIHPLILNLSTSSFFHFTTKTHQIFLHGFSVTPIQKNAGNFSTVKLFTIEKKKMKQKLSLLFLLTCTQKPAQLFQLNFLYHRDRKIRAIFPIGFSVAVIHKSTYQLYHICTFYSLIALLEYRYMEIELYFLKISAVFPPFSL